MNFLSDFELYIHNLDLSVACENMCKSAFSSGDFGFFP